MKRFLSAILVFMLLFSQLVAAADSAEAKIMRLERTEGTVTLKNASEKEIAIKEGMKISSGYSLATKAASYAYVSLDESKAVKLDGLSKVSIKKKGKKLELLLSSGKLFFNVKVPLKEDEAMEVRTSTTVTGIRGTSGFFEVVSATQSIVGLTSGKVESMSFNPLTGAVEPVIIHAGEVATFTAVAGEPEPQVEVVSLTAAAIPGFVATEIKKDTELKKVTEEQSKIDMTQVVENADTQLKEDQKQQSNTEKAATDAAPTEVQDTKPLFPEAPATGGNPPVVTPDPPTQGETVELDTPTAAELNAKLGTEGVKAVTVKGAVSFTETVTVPAEKKLVLQGAVTLSAPLEVLGNVEASSTVTTQSGTGTINIGSTTRAGSAAQFTVGLNGTLTNGGNINLISGSLVNKGNMSNTGKCEINGVLDNEGKLTNSGTITNNGTIKSSNQFENSGTVTNNGTVTNSGYFNNSKILTNLSKFESTGAKASMTNTDTIINGDDKGTNALFDSDAPTFNNSGTITYKSGVMLIKGMTNSSLNTPGIHMNYELGSKTSRIYANTLENLLKYVEDGVKLTLIGGVTLGPDDNPVIPADKSITLNLGSNHLTLGEGNSITVDGTLNLTGGGAIRSNTEKNDFSMVVLNGTLNMDSGVIELDAPAQFTGGYVVNDTASGAKFNMTGGAVKAKNTDRLCKMPSVIGTVNFNSYTGFYELATKQAY